ncbi:Flagellar motor protein MotA [Beijerinckiaceae bacterium RH AL1]|jgi:hypothetical protein|nr:flagellar motor protein MotA [Beijerinckiaceae bacterium]VVB48655.1 Flagellar motor protein MotA [Beijerinckiaceae bacterium RH CH11]VVB48737.1 Flagellar motor protein MotA [Beijerinckiaceae bacterium RH AL8]VVC56503.1 Flagellar motor protein MotA [Beijerinckiaceae bacterium RH AL1]
MAVAETDDHLRLSSPRIFLVRIIVFLILIGFIALILNQQITRAFMANPGLNGFIFFTLFLGIVYGIRNVARLFGEARWVNALPRGEAANVKRPILLAPMATLVGDKPPTAAMSTVTLRVILDSIGTRLDEARELSRYLTGLLIFLGLLGTFWGLIQTVASIAGVIQSMGAGGDSAASFEELKAGLAVPLSSMSLAFTSSLFGLAGSLILGFIDLQAGQAQNRFYTELEDALTAHTSAEPTGNVDLDKALARLGDPAQSRASSQALANLAEGIQSLVQHMRAEQQQIRDWVEAQADQNGEIRTLLRRLASEPERR